MQAVLVRLHGLSSVVLLNVLVQKGVVNGNNAVRNLKCA